MHFAGPLGASSSFSHAKPGSGGPADSLVELDQVCCALLRSVLGSRVKGAGFSDAQRSFPLRPEGLIVRSSRETRVCSRSSDMALQARFAAAVTPGSRVIPAVSRLAKSSAATCSMRTLDLHPENEKRATQYGSYASTALGACKLQTFRAGQEWGSRQFAGRPGAGVRAAAAQAVVAPTEEETQKMIAEVRRVLDEKHSYLPLGEYGRDDEAMIEWFLRDRKFEVEPTVSKLAKAIKWRHEFGVAFLKPEDVAEEAATGKAYLHDHPALDGRPVIVVVAAKHFPNEERLVASEQLCVYLIEQALARLPEGEEKFLGIFDLRGFNHHNADFKFVGFLIQVFFNYYPKRLHKVLFVDAPPIFQPGWRMMKPMLKSYASLVEFRSADDVRDHFFEPNKAPPSFLQ